MEKGDIVEARDKDRHPHYIVFLEELNNSSFSACCISHENKKGNIKMEEEHFCNVDENNVPYPIQYDDSYLIYKKLKKNYYWLISENVIGRLTEEGIKYVESKIPQKAVRHAKPIWKK